MGQEIPVFAIGLLFGAALLLVGLAAGIWVGRRTIWHDARGDSPDVPLHHLLEGLFRGADGVANVVSGCRDALGHLENQCREAHPEPGDPRQGTACAVFDAMLQTNEQVRRRLEAAEETLQRQASEISSYMSEARTDTLTGLPNRRALDGELTRRITESRDCGRPLSLVLMDIDHFKRLNDQYGHPAGDAVLAEVGRILLETVREPQFVARLGGEEFAIVLPNCRGSDVTGTAERVRLAIACQGIRFEHAVLRITISYGAAQWQSGEQASALMKRSDQALYASKGAGRNCGHLHDGARCIPVASDASGQVKHEPPSRPASARLLECADFRQVCQDVRQRLLSLVEREG